MHPTLTRCRGFHLQSPVVFSLESQRKAMQGGRSGTSGEDRISILPEPLLCHILTFHSTKESVRTSVLSSRWRDLWLWVPRLDLHKSDFSEDNTCVSFIDKFLNFRGDSYLRGFKLNTDDDGDEGPSVEACLMRVVNKCKIQHFEIKSYFGFCYLEMPLVFSICDTLVSLKLTFVIMSDYDQSCSLPYLKTLHLEKVVFPSDEAAEALISSSPVLKELKMSQSRYDSVQVLRVRSKSLKSFTLERDDTGPVDNSLDTVVMDTPGLECLNLIDYQYTSFEIVRMSETVKFDIDVVLSLVYCNFLTFVSHARDMTISRRTLESIYYHLEINRRSKFHGLARLRATMFLNTSAAMLPVILEACPNLKHLTLVLVHHFLVTEGTSRLLNLFPPSLVSSLESVDIQSPITDKATELELVRYFLENSTKLKKIVLRLNQSCLKKHKPGLLKQLFESPRCSGLFQFVIL